MKWKKGLALALALTLTLALAGCTNGNTGGDSGAGPDGAAPPSSDDDWSYVQGNGTLKIGYTVFEPMNYTDAEGNFVGFETEFATAVCEKLGLTPEFVEINWDSKLLELESKNIDCIWNGMTITDDLKAAISVSEPYIKNMQVVIIRAADAGKYTDTAGLAGATVEAEAGSAGEGAVQEDEHLSQATYVSAPRQIDTLLEVKTGAADAAVLDYVLAKASIGEGTDFADLMMIPGLELSVEEYGVGFRKGSGLADRMNQAMEALIADGTLNTIAEKYGLAEQLLANQK